MFDTTETKRPSLDALPRAQRERLAHIDFVLYFLGELRRADVVDKFETGSAGATRDIAIYRDMAPENLEFDTAAKVYRPTPEFAPVFQHAARRVLTALTEGFGEGLGDELEPQIRCDTPTPLTFPSLSVLAPITRAINRRKAVSLTYTSVNSGRSQKEIVPIALVDTGIRWHVRAFDRLHKEFRDFVLTRMENPCVLEDAPILKEETAEADTQWTRVIELELVPHPNHPRPEVVKMDYGMQDGVLRVRVRAVNAGYMLRRWSVDCSPNHTLKGIEYALWLPDPLALYGATNAHLAPGYIDPRKPTSTIQKL